MHCITLHYRATRRQRERKKQHNKTHTQQETNMTHSSNEFWRIWRTTRSSSRILSLIVLLLSLAPLGSIYFLISSMKLQFILDPTTENNDNNNNSEHPGKTHLAGVVIDLGEFEVQFEKVWVALWDGQQPPSEQTALALGPTIFSSGHFRVVLPWLISIFLGVVVPACLSIASFVWSNYSTTATTMTAMYDDDRSESVLHRRRRKLEKRLQGFSMVLEEQHIVGNIEEEVVDEQKNKKKNYNTSTRNSWMVPRPGESFTTASSDTGPIKLRVVSEECAICREPYQIDETIVWSPNTACMHCFHDDCIQPWLLRHSTKSQGCPCCRQPFVRGPTSASKADVYDACQTSSPAR